MSDTIRRFECPTCGRKGRAEEGSHLRGWTDPCPGVPVERTYVAIDAIPYRAIQRLCVERDAIAPDILVNEIYAAITAVTGEPEATPQCGTCGGEGALGPMHRYPAPFDSEVPCPSCKGTGEASS